MRPSAFIGALVGACLGAMVWAGVASVTGLEIGWIAWGIGGAVGFGAAVLGGAGATTGVVCAVLALASIFAGKWLAVDMIAEKEIRKATHVFATMDIYQETKADADAFAQVLYEHEYADYMIDRSYTNAPFADDVTALELAAFTQEIVPQLREFKARNPSFQQWKEGVANEAVALWEATGSNFELVKENLGPIDIIFGLLGVFTAFQVGVRGLGSAGGANRVPMGTRVPTECSYTSATDRYAPGSPASDAGILKPEPPNPYASPTPGSQPASGPPEPFRPRKIARLSQEPSGTPGNDPNV